MRSLEILREEHDAIDTILTVLEATADRLEQGRHVDPQMLRGLMMFLERFVGGSHQAKEEQLLFPVLAARCTDAAFASLQQFQSEHEMDRNLMRTLAERLEGLEKGKSHLIDSVVTAARAYAKFARQHLTVENEFFERVARHDLSKEDDERLVQEFGVVERVGVGPTGREWFHQIMEDYRDIVSTWGTWTDVRSGGRGPS
jgi:hemerythrin-like domain-containing protein